MLKELVFAVALATTSFAVTGCSSKDAATSDDAAKGEQNPVDELKGMSDELQKDIDGIMQPINDAETVSTDIDNLVKKYGIKASDLKVMGKTALDGGEVTLSADIKPEAKDDVMALMAKIKGIGTGLTQAPDKVQALLAKLPAKLANVPVLYGKAQASLQVKANNPFGNADEKKKAKDDLASLDKIKTDTMTKVQNIKTQVTGLPQKASEAMAKLKSALG
jgi:hypothetical protein